MITSRLFPIIFIVATLGLFFGYIQPTLSGSIASLNAEIQDLDTALLAAQQFKQKELELTRARNEIAPEQLARLEAFLPDSVDNVQLIVDLNSLAARSGVSLSDFDIQGSATDTNDAAAAGAAPGAMPADPAMTAASSASSVLGANLVEPVDTLELSVAATGSYAAFRTFLAGVEQSLRPLDIVELSVDDSATGVYTYDITFRLYWLR
ncbi:MAG TPA: hypothetical protein VNU25_02260 [Candidatus Paceibacterota bacterium]|nr:hypothetical protein [Candidatus Paceibacterota bacterium]